MHCNALLFRVVCGFVAATAAAALLADSAVALRVARGEGHALAPAGLRSCVTAQEVRNSCVRASPRQLSWLCFPASGVPAAHACAGGYAIDGLPCLPVCVPNGERAAIPDVRNTSTSDALGDAEDVPPHPRRQLGDVALASAVGPAREGDAEQASAQRDGHDAALPAVGLTTAKPAPEAPAPRANNLTTLNARVRVGQVLYINMADDLDKGARMAQLLNASQALAGVPHTRINAVMGRELNELRYLKARRIGQRGYTSLVSDVSVWGEHLTRGGLGCLESHVQAWRRASESDAATLVLEDDVELLSGFDAWFPQFVDALPSGFGLAYLTRLIGQPIEHALTPHGDLLWKMQGEHWGTYAYLVSPAAARTLLQHIYPADVQVDSMIIRIARQTGMGVYMSRRNMLTTNNAADRPSRVQHSAVGMRIPRLFHFIMLGGSPMPQHLQQNIDKWAALHPGWRVKLWRDADVPPLHNQALFDQATLQAQRADILRYELVLRHGGVYADLDFAPLKNIETLLGGVEAFAAHESDTFVCNGIFGAVPNHRLSRVLVASLERNFLAFSNSTVNQQTGPYYMTRVVRKLQPEFSRTDFRVFAPHVFFPFGLGERAPTTFSDYSFAAHYFEQVRCRAACRAASCPALRCVLMRHGPQSWVGGRDAVAGTATV